VREYSVVSATVSKKLNVVYDSEPGQKCMWKADLQFRYTQVYAVTATTDGNY
jgi:hypothetical protein